MYQLLLKMSHIQNIKISRSALLHNLQVMRQLSPRSLLLAVVKSNAYGHGLKPVVSLLKGKVDWYGVNSLAEAMDVQHLDAKTPILVMGLNGAELSEIEKLPLEARQVGRLHIVLGSMDSVSYLQQKGLTSIPFHLKIDTGLSRLGIHYDQIPEFLQYVKKYPNLKWSGIMTHFANVEDVVEQDYAQKQLQLFQSACHKAKTALAAGSPSLLCHAAASAAVMLLPNACMDMIRVGIALYGLWPSRQTQLSFLSSDLMQSPKLRPVLTWCSRIIQINPVKKGAFVGYGCTYRVQEDARIAVIPVGYYEGYMRNLSNRAHVLVRGQQAPILGRVSMNMICADLSRIPQAQVGDEVTLIGKDGKEEISADRLAELSDTINYEIVTRIHPKLPRTIVA